MLSGLSIAVLCYNEEATLARVVYDSVLVGNQLAERCEVIIINDCSDDDSFAIAESLAQQLPEVRVIHHPSNRGFGAAQRSGFQAASLEFVTTVPGDAQFDVNDLHKLAAAIDDHDIVIGYRVARGDYLYRRVKTRVFWWALRLFFGIRFRDINWVKLYRRRALESIDLVSNNIGIETEIVHKAQHRGLRLTEVPVGYLPRQAGVAQGDRAKNVVHTIGELIGLRLRRL